MIIFVFVLRLLFVRMSRIFNTYCMCVYVVTNKSSIYLSINYKKKRGGVSLPQLDEYRTKSYARLISYLRRSSLCSIYMSWCPLAHYMVEYKVENWYEHLVSVFVSSKFIKPILIYTCSSSSIVSFFRLIDLFSYFLKLQNMNKNKLEWSLECKNLLLSNQFDFGQSRSTVDGASISVSNIQHAFTNNKSVFSVFLDVSAT